ncbi:Antigen, partial [Armadillidium nasatum]
MVVKKCAKYCSRFLFCYVYLILQFKSTLGDWRTLSNARGPGYETERFAFPSEGIKVRPHWLVIGGRKVVPGSIYRVAVEAFRSNVIGEDTSLTVRASISRDDQQVAYGKVKVQSGELSHIIMQIPGASVPGNWHLNLEGREGINELPLFKNTTSLIFSPNFLTILIQTSRPVYKNKQTVRFRAVMLTRELKPYEEPVNIFVLDPRGLIMRRWPSRPPGDGVINLSFDLPEYPDLGNWTIQVRARQQVQNKTIVVEQYFRPRFEVFVRLPHTFKVTDDAITGVVVANMTNWRDVHGNCSVKLQIATNEDFPIPTRFETIHSEFLYNFTGYYPFHISMHEVARRTSDLKDIIVRVYASVGDSFGWRIQHGWALARIVQEEAKVSFLGDQPLFFKPGMPLSVHVFVSYKDNHPFEEDELEFAQLAVTFRSEKTEVIQVSGEDLLDKNGVVMCTAEIPPKSKTLEISASFTSSSGMTASTTMVGILHHSPRDHHIQVETSTYNAIPGQFIILHVRCNFYTPHINFIVVSNGLVVYSDRESINDIGYPTITTFSLPASSQMSPIVKILVWATDSNFEVLSHSIAIPVTPLGKHEVGVRWNEHKDHSGGSAEVKMLGEAGAFFGTSAIWEETHLMDSDHDFNEARILNHMLGFHDSGITVTDDIIPHVRRASTRSREGHGSTVRFFPTPTSGPDAPTTFNFTEIVLLTDAMIYYHPSKAS